MVKIAGLLERRYSCNPPSIWEAPLFTESCILPLIFSGSEEGVFWKRPEGSLKNVSFPEILETLEILEIPQSVESEGEAVHFLEILDTLEILKILESCPVKRPPS